MTDAPTIKVRVTGLVPITAPESTADEQGAVDSWPSERIEHELVLPADATKGDVEKVLKESGE